MGLFSKGESSNSPSPTPDPQYRVEYTDADGLVSESYSDATSAQNRAEIASEKGYTNVTVKSIKRGR